MLGTVLDPAVTAANKGGFSVEVRLRAEASGEPGGWNTF